MATRIRIREDTSTRWTAADPVLADHEIGGESDTGRFKIGDGSTAWSSLAYYDNKAPSNNKSYTVATLPAAASWTGSTIYVSDETGGGTIAFSDDTNWRRVQDRAIVS